MKLQNIMMIITCFNLSISTLQASADRSPKTLEAAQSLLCLASRVPQIDHKPRDTQKVCLLCTQPYRGFTNHLLAHHINLLANKEGRIVFKCTTCPKVCTRASGYMQHLHAHTEKKQAHMPYL